jgi:hypothetical protein
LNEWHYIVLGQVLLRSKLDSFLLISLHHLEAQMLEIVQLNIGKVIDVLVQRQPSLDACNFETVCVFLIPHEWNGNGFLGCHILPYAG